MKALISPLEVIDLWDGTKGIRVCEFSETGFEVAEPLFWADYSGNEHPANLYWDGTSIKSAPLPPVSEITRLAESIIQNKLDTVAEAWGYKDLATVCSYASSSIPQWANDAKMLSAWRDQVWTWAFANFPNITQQTDPVEFVAGMPATPIQTKV